MTTTTDIPLLDALTTDISVDVVRPDKARYARLRRDGRTLAYVNPRKDGIVLDFAARAVEAAPKTLQRSLEYHEGKGRATLHVTSRNIKTARSLLAWVAEHS